jgi:hypothetical protein
VPHISRVFREISDTTAVNRSAPRMHRESEGKSRGIPHLAKNERDVGHPSVRGGISLLRNCNSFFKQMIGSFRESIRDKSFSAHVRWGDPDFLYVAPTQDCVCGFQCGKPHEVCQRQQAAQEIRGDVGHPSSFIKLRLQLCLLAGFAGARGLAFCNCG